jgi:hypothetical protein
MSSDKMTADKTAVDKMTVDKMTHRHRITHFDKKKNDAESCIYISVAFN